MLNWISSHVEGHMYQAMIFSLKVLHILIIYESANYRQESSGFF